MTNFKSSLYQILNESVDDSILCEAFSATMKSKLSKETLNNIGKFLHSIDIAVEKTEFGEIADLKNFKMSDSAKLCPVYTLPDGTTFSRRITKPVLIAVTRRGDVYVITMNTNGRGAEVIWPEAKKSVVPRTLLPRVEHIFYVRKAVFVHDIRFGEDRYSNSHIVDRLVVKSEILKKRIEQSKKMKESSPALQKFIEVANKSGIFRRKILSISRPIYDSGRVGKYCRVKASGNNLEEKFEKIRVYAEITEDDGVVEGSELRRFSINVYAPGRVIDNAEEARIMADFWYRAVKVFEAYEKLDFTKDIPALNADATDY